MRRAIFSALTIFAVGAAACDRAPPADTATAASDNDTVAESVDVASHAGQSFDAFVAAPGMDRFALNRLDLAPAERVRLAQAMVVSRPSRLISGGGAQALVFTGCAQAGCDAGKAVLAIGGQGETFVGVSDAAGATEFIPDDRMEALLRLNSPTRRWDDPGTEEAASGAPTP